MKNKKTVKILALSMGALMMFSLASCKKKGCTDSKATNYDSKAKKDDGSCKYPDPPAVVCVPDNISGTFNGTGVLSGIPNSSMTVVVTKQGCQSCRFVSGAVTENVVNIEESSTTGGFNGQDADGNSVSFTIEGDSLHLETDEINFSGVR